MTEINHRTVKTNGINMHIAEAGSGPLVLLVHGFPESWFSWRHQIPALAEAGYHAVAMDVRGYGRTDQPERIEDYSMKHMTGDMVGLVRALGEEQAVIVGHDWGSPIAWNSALLHPDTFRAVVGMSVPYMPRPPMPPLQLMRAAFANNFFYIIYFQEPGVAEAELEADVDKSIRSFMYVASGDYTPEASVFQKPADATFLDGMPEPPRQMSWITEEELQYFINEFKRTGFRGGLNRYRNMDRDWEELPQLAGARVTQPAAFIAGDRDGVIAMNPSGIETMKSMCDDLRACVLVPGAGHWTQQERPRETNEFLIEFLRGL